MEKSYSRLLQKPSDGKYNPPLKEANVLKAGRNYHGDNDMAFNTFLYFNHKD